ncbi:MAG: RraA family protein [Pseudomonadota bacterium]
MDPTLLARLRGIDTPTVCNAIEVAQGRRGFDGFTRGTLIATEPDAPPMVGFARTAAIRAVVPSDEPPEVIRQRRADYHRAVAADPRPSVVVIQDLDGPDRVGAWWGEVNAAIHKGLGLAGALTDGLVRDLGDLPTGFPILAGGIGVSHGFVRVETIGDPVRVFGLDVRDGDLIHADRHGAVVIPPNLLGSLQAAIEKLQGSERLVLDPASRDDFDLDSLLDAWAAFEKART